MNKKYVYVLRLDMYGDWASENGACDIIGVYATLDDILEELGGYLKEELNEEHILDDKDINITKILDECKKSVNSCDYSDTCIYADEEDFNNGYDMGDYVISKMEVM